MTLTPPAGSSSDVGMRGRWPLAEPIAQGWTGACVAVAWVNALRVGPAQRTDLDRSLAVEQLYWPAQRRDRWPGGEYPGARPWRSGTSVDAVSSVAVAIGLTHAVIPVTSPDDLVRAVGNVGPAVLGLPWPPRPDHGERSPAARHAVTVVDVLGCEHGTAAVDVVVVDPRRADRDDRGMRGICSAWLWRVWDDLEVVVPTQEGGSW